MLTTSGFFTVLWMPQCNDLRCMHGNPQLDQNTRTYAYVSTSKSSVLLRIQHVLPKSSYSFPETRSQARVCTMLYLCRPIRQSHGSCWISLPKRARITTRSVVASLQSPSSLSVVWRSCTLTATAVSVSSPRVHSVVFAMEYLPGGDLYQRLSDKGTLSLRETVAWTAQAVLAIEDLHAKNIVHRDVKPGWSARKRSVLRLMYVAQPVHEYWGTAQGTNKQKMKCCFFFGREGGGCSRTRLFAVVH